MSGQSKRARRGGGPPLLLAAGVSVGLFVASLIAGAALGDGSYPSPFQAAALRFAYITGNSAALKASAVLQFAAAVPLAIFAAAAPARLRHLGVRTAGPTMSLAGGLLASALLMMSALVQWTLSRPEVVATPSTVLMLQDLAFVTGGPGHVVPLGLLVAGLAVPALLHRLLPRWLAIVGVVVAALAELSTLSLVWPAAAVLLPAARFPILIWLVVVAWRLPHERRDVPVSGAGKPGWNRSLQTQNAV